MVENNAKLSLECNDRKSSFGGRANDCSVSQAEEMRECETQGREQSNLAYEADERSDVVDTFSKQPITAVTYGTMPDIGRDYA